MLCLKGPTLATLLHGDPALRCFADLDLLVQQSDYSRAETVLRQLGLQPIVNALFSQLETTPREFALERERDFDFPHHRYLIELHWCLTTYEFPRALETAGLFARRQQVLVGGQPLSTLSDRDIAVHLCHHGTLHSWAKLRYLADFVSALSAIGASGWGAFRETVHGQGLSRPLSVAVPLCQEFLGMELPENAMPAGRRYQPAQWAIKFLRSDIIASSTRSESQLFALVFRMATAEKRRYRALFSAAKNMFTPTSNDYQWIVLPKPLHWLYAVIRPFRRIGIMCAFIRGCRKSPSPVERTNSR